MVGQAARSHANGSLVTARSFATVLGFASAAPVIGRGGYTAAFAVNAASFLVSATALLVLRPRTDEVAAWGERAFVAGTCLMSLSFVGAFAGLPTPVLIVAAAAAGFADGCTEIVYTSRLQAVGSSRTRREAGRARSDARARDGPGPARSRSAGKLFRQDGSGWGAYGRRADGVVCGAAPSGGGWPRAVRWASARRASPGCPRASTRSESARPLQLHRLAPGRRCPVPAALPGRAGAGRGRRVGRRPTGRAGDCPAWRLDADRPHSSGVGGRIPGCQAVTLPKRWLAGASGSLP